MRPSTLAIVLLALFVSSSAGQTTARERFGEAGALLRTGKFEDVVRRLEPIASEELGGYGHYLLGYAYLQTFRAEEAERALRAAVAARPENHAWHHMLSWALLRQSRNRAAAGVLDRALALEPLPEYFYARAMCRLNLAEASKARADLEACLRLRPKHAAALHKLASLRFDTGDAETAEGLLARCLECEPDHLEARFLAGLVAARRKKAEVAVSHFRRVLQSVPTHAGAHYNLGRALIKLGRRDEGRRHLERFKELGVLQDRLDHLVANAGLDQRNVDRRLELVDLAVKLGRSELAVEHARAARVLDATRADVYRRLAAALALSGDDAGARAAKLAADRLAEVPR